ncbi:unnamed protein product [Gadus morhua 'NCC']
MVRGAARHPLLTAGERQKGEAEARDEHVLAVPATLWSSRAHPPLAPLSVMRCHSVTWSPEEAPVANQTPRSLSEEAEGHTPLGPGFEKPTSQQGPTSEASIENSTADAVTGGAGWWGDGVVGAQNATRGFNEENRSQQIQGNGHVAIALNRMALLGRKTSQGKGHVVLPSPDSDGSSGAEDPGRARARGLWGRPDKGYLDPRTPRGVRP